MKINNIKRSSKILLTSLLVVSICMMSVNATESKISTTQGPGPVEPLDVIEMGNGYKDTDGWEINGLSRSEQEDGVSMILTENQASLSKQFEYPTWDYSDLSIQIKQLSHGMTWKLSVIGTSSNAQKMVLQDDSYNANSQFGEFFKYSLEGIAGSENQSDWNDETLSRKQFNLTFEFSGKVGDQILLGDLNRIKPNYNIPSALPSNVKGNYAGVNFSGDTSLDVDTLKNDDIAPSINNKYLKEHQWASLPYSRLVINPGWEFDSGTMTPVDSDLDFRFGTYYGIKGNANYAVGAESKSGFQPSFYNAMLDIDGNKLEENSIKSAWYPHKLERSAEVSGKGKISLIDFMVDTSTMGRIIDFDSCGGFLNITVKESTQSGGAIRGQHNLSASWDDANQVVLKTDDLENKGNKNLFYQAMRVIALNDDGSYNEALTNKIKTPLFQNGIGKYNIPQEIKKIGLVIGYATREEGKNKAIQRALNSSVNGNLLDCYKNTKDYWNTLLRRVPVPQEWGITDTNVRNYDSVTIEKHKVEYYAGWVLNSINTLGVTPETGYAYTQQALGKPSRQTGGANMTPANNCWEGLLQIQNIMYVDPSAAWSGMEGFMSMVDANGFLNGEVLPVRMAQTLWMVHNVSPDLERLKAMYPALARHLKYKISDPRWIYGNTQTQNEIDQEYVTSWLNDAVYMMKICKELGGDYAKEAVYWETEYQKSLDNYADWFFCDPLSHEAKYSYPQDPNGLKTLRNGAGLADANDARGLWTRILHIDGDVTQIKDMCVSNTDGRALYTHSAQQHTLSPKPARTAREWLQVILSGLVIKDIPTNQVQQLEQFFLDVNNPALENAGSDNVKWAPNSLLVYGLINRGFYDEAKNQLDAYLVKTIEVWEFCENYMTNQKGPKGTSPTSFGASQIIEVTMLKNGVINDGSGVREIKNWKEGKNKAKNPLLEYNIDKNYSQNELLELLPKEITQTYDRENFDGEKYQVNKVTYVQWDFENIDRKENMCIVTGKTETNGIVEAKIYYK